METESPENGNEKTASQLMSELGKKNLGVRKTPPVPQLLRDMRKVIETEAADDKTPQQRTLRKLLEQSTNVFLKQLRDEEESHRVRYLAAKYAREEEAADPDAGGEAALVLVENLLAEWDSSQG